jgi:hypothetical protein
VQVLSKNHTSDEDDDDEEGDDDDDDDDASHSLPDTAWDEADCVYRCQECCSEVVYGFCTACTRQHSYESVSAMLGVV